MNYNYLLPLGSECFVNSQLDGTNLAKYKLYYSVFNGTRLINNLSSPISRYLSDNSGFMDQYSDNTSWELSYDGSDLQGYNYDLNIRRCHLHQENPYDFINKCILANKSFSLKNTVLLIDLNDYCILDESKLQELCSISSNYKFISFIRPKELATSISDINRINKSSYDTNIELTQICNLFNPIILDGEGDGKSLYSEFYNKFENMGGLLA